MNYYNRERVPRALDERIGNVANTNIGLRTTIPRPDNVSRNTFDCSNHRYVTGLRHDEMRSAGARDLM